MLATILWRTARCAPPSTSMCGAIRFEAGCGMETRGRIRAPSAVALARSPRQDFLDMERRWLHLAHSYEFTERLSAITVEVERERPCRVSNFAQSPASRIT